MMGKVEKGIFGIIAAALLLWLVWLHAELMTANVQESCCAETLLQFRGSWPFYFCAGAFFFCVALLQSRFVKTALLISWLLLLGSGAYLLFSMCGHESFTHIPFIALGVSLLWGILCLVLMFRKWT